MECKIKLQVYKNKVSILDEEIYCSRLGAAILFQCTNTYSEAEAKARFCWWGDGLPTVWSCGGDSWAFCHRVWGAQCWRGSPLEFFFQEQSYSSLHSGQSLAWDHVRADIDDPCGAIADFYGVIADFCGAIADPCGPAALSRSADP